jgi:hypothetical protein
MLLKAKNLKAFRDYRTCSPLPETLQRTGTRPEQEDQYFLARGQFRKTISPAQPERETTNLEVSLNYQHSSTGTAPATKPET